MSTVPSDFGAATAALVEPVVSAAFGFAGAGAASAASVPESLQEASHTAVGTSASEVRTERREIVPAMRITRKGSR